MAQGSTSSSVVSSAWPTSGPRFVWVWEMGSPLGAEGGAEPERVLRLLDSLVGSIGIIDRVRVSSRERLVAGGGVIESDLSLLILAAVFEVEPTPSGPRQAGRLATREEPVVFFEAARMGGSLGGRDMAVGPDPVGAEPTWMEL